jgi:hypothetical protein
MTQEQIDTALMTPFAQMFQDFFDTHGPIKSEALIASLIVWFEQLKSDGVPVQ